LLDEIFYLFGAKFDKSYDVLERVSPKVSASTFADTIIVNEIEVIVKSSNSCFTSIMLYKCVKGKLC